MAYEILNNARVTPMRLHALVQLIVRLPASTPATRQALAAFLQPRGLEAEEQLINDLVRAGLSIDLIAEDGSSKQITLRVPPEEVQTVEAYRTTMQRLVLGARESEQPNYLLSLFTAWYAAQDGDILQWTAKDYEDKFSTQLFGDGDLQEERRFNTTKLNGWRTWAEFLGWGWPMRMRTRFVFIPDAYKRVAPFLPQLLPANKSLVEFGTFVEGLAERCPELDTGVLYRHAWQESRGGEHRGNQVSLMLSNALRGLHDAGFIEVRRQKDARITWALYPAVGHEVNQLTHIRLGAK